MIALQKTKHSQFCLDFFKSNKNIGLNIAHKDFFLAKEFIKQGYDDDLNYEALSLLKDFEENLKSMKLKLVIFAFSYNKNIDKYVYRYVIRSKKFNNSDLQIDGILESLNIPFGFFPQMFSTSLIDIIKQIPFEQLRQVSIGR